MSNNINDRIDSTYKESKIIDLLWSIENKLVKEPLNTECTLLTAIDFIKSKELSRDFAKYYLNKIGVTNKDLGKE